jgi:hypothetical protein
MFSILVSDVHSYDYMVQRFIYATVKMELGVELIGPIYVLSTFQIVQTYGSIVIFCEELVAEMEVLCVCVCACACVRACARLCMCVWFYFKCSAVS